VTTSPASRLRSPLGGALLTGLLALLYRGWLTARYYGAEEEDWGNLGITFGTLQSGFTYVEMEHMPLFTTLAALATAFTGDAESGGEFIAVLGGAVGVGTLTWMGWRWLSPAAGLIAGLLLIVQPDSALYAATPLRISTYTALSLLAVAMIGERRAWLAGAFLSLAFLCRFDVLLTVTPALVVLIGLRFGQSRDTREALGERDAGGLWRALVPLAAVVVLWSAFYKHQLGTWAFWGDVAARNTGEYGHLGLIGRLDHGLETLFGVATQMMPQHVGHAVLPLALVGLALLFRGHAQRPSEGRWLGLCAAIALAFFAITVTLSAYQPDHNLYWKWLSALVPYLLLLAVHAAVFLVALTAGAGGSARRALAGAVALGLLVATSLDWQTETQRQLQRSDLWYGTQIRLMEWVEESLPADVGIVADLIPSTYEARHSQRMRFFSWSHETLPHGAPEKFGAWLVDNRISLVIWFREDWVGASRAAPYLQGGWPVDAGPVRLQPIAREDGYGFIAYQVTGSVAVPEPTTAPPADAGATGSPM
jgi:hypothetical protein